MCLNQSQLANSEKTSFFPRSPYACAKTFAYYITKVYREAYKMFACNGILFNHESPRRGENFVTRKITLSLARIKLGLQDKLFLGNLDAKRDWGYAKDYVEAMWLMLQHDKPDDYVIATGKQHSVRDFCERAFLEVGVKLEWEGKGIDEKGIVADIEPTELLKKYDRRDQLRTLRKGQTVVSVDPRYFRPTEVETLLGDPSKARQKLGWKQEISFKQMVKEMVDNDLKEGMREAIWKQKGFEIPDSFEANM